MTTVTAAVPAVKKTRRERRHRRLSMQWWRSLLATLSALRKEGAHYLLLIIIVTILAGATLTRWAESYHAEAIIRDWWDATWWAVVTFSTVGYGDLFPKSVMGRIVAMFLMISGVVLMSLVTATIASVLVERRIREASGLEGTTLDGHSILCGWNENAEEVLAGLINAAHAEGTAEPQIVMVSEQEEDVMNGVRFKYRGTADVRFVRGDFSNEAFLKMADIKHARTCVILADTSPANMHKSDERVIKAVLTIKAISPDVRVCVEALDRGNVNHLRRARADEVVLRGRHEGFFLVNAVTAPGLPKAVDDLLSLKGNSSLRRVPMPESLVGKTFWDAVQHFRKKDRSMLIGIVSEAPGVDISDILAGDQSAIDQFILRKFQEAGQDLSAAVKQEEVIINPPDDRPIESWDMAIIVPATENGA